MNFSDAFKQTSQICRFSPDGVYLANAVQYRLIVRQVNTLQISRLFTCLDAIQHVQWSADSQFILCAMYNRSLIQVWSLEQPEWTCKIDEGSAGLIDVCWSPDSRHILTTADFHLRITVWSLVNKTVSYIKYPKQCPQGLQFSADGKFLALAERRDCKDSISLFDCNTWQLIKHFSVETEDLSGILWSPDSRMLCIWESCLQYKVLLYSLDGRCQATYSAYEMALGIKCVSWSSTSQFLAVGSYDEKVRLLNHITWKMIAEFPHLPALDSSSTMIFQEVTKKMPLLKGETHLSAAVSQTCASQYEIVTGSIQTPVIRPDLNKANPKLGVSTVNFSANCQYMYSKNDNMPNVLWIWDIPKLRLATVLLQLSPIKTVAWDPTQSRLALCTGTNKIYMWSPKGSLSVQIPCEATFTAQDVKWHRDGSALLIISRDQMCVCFLTDSEDVTS